MGHKVHEAIISTTNRSSAASLLSAIIANLRYLKAPFSPLSRRSIIRIHHSAPTISYSPSIILFLFFLYSIEDFFLFFFGEEYLCDNYVSVMNKRWRVRSKSIRFKIVTTIEAFVWEDIQITPVSIIYHSNLNFFFFFFLRLN